MVLKIYERFCALLLFLAACIALSEVFMRLVFNITYSFVIDLAVWLTVWAMILISGPLLLNGRHVSIDFIIERQKGLPRLFLAVLNGLCTLIYGAIISWGAFILVKDHYSLHLVFPKYFEIPMWIIDLCMPIGFSVFTICAFVELRKASLKKK